MVAVAEAGHRIDPDTRLVGGVVIGTGLVSLDLLRFVRPDYWSRLVQRITDRLFREGVNAETQNLFGPSFGWLLLFGFVLVLAVPYLAWSTWRVRDDARWAVVVAYGWYLFILATVQIRFVGELALFAGLGFVHLAERVDVSRPPVPFDALVSDNSIILLGRGKLGAIVTLFFLVGGLGIVQVPVNTNQITIDDTQYETAAWMADYSEERGWTYPENYVFSQWSYNRVYNYFVSGNYRSYTYAQRQYGQFLGSTEPGTWYERLRNRPGFVVYACEASIPGSVGSQLAAYGSRTSNVSGLSHYRAVYVSEQYRVFKFVQGATITRTARPNSTLTLSTDVSLDGRLISYKSRGAIGPDGSYRVIVLYPGEYAVSDETVRVSEGAVTQGRNVTV